MCERLLLKQKKYVVLFVPCKKTEGWSSLFTSAKYYYYYYYRLIICVIVIIDIDISIQCAYKFNNKYMDE